MCVVRLTSLLLLAHWLGYGPQHLKGGVSDVPHLSAVPQPTIQRTHHWGNKPLLLLVCQVAAVDPVS